MKVLVIDAQGGGMGRMLVEGLKRALPEQPVTAVGTNALATSAMLKAGAQAAATGENAVKVCCRDADVIMGPIGIVMKDAMMGEITAEMAAAVAESRAKRILIPVLKCATYIAGSENQTLQSLITDALAHV